MKFARRHPRGYVLLLTLLLLVVAAAALAGITRAALGKVVHASRSEDDLRRRWGVVSCRASLLPQADRVFTGASATSPQMALEFRLSGQPTTLIFGDEQAKANVNTLYAIARRDGATRAVRQLLQAAGGDLHVELSPMALETESPDDQGEPDVVIEPVFDGWAQVFPRASPDDVSRMTSNLTCWSDGLLNVRRASRESILAVCDKVLRPGEVTKVLAARAKDSDFDLWETLDQLNLPEKRYERAERLLTDASQCYSLWIITRTGGRQWYDLAVAESLSAGGTPDVRVFAW